MKRLLYMYIFTLLVGCTMESEMEPYGDDMLNTLSISVIYPDEYNHYDREGMTVTVKDIDKGNSYMVTLDNESQATILLTNGRYIVQYSATHSEQGTQEIFNATADQVLVADADVGLSLSPERSVAGGLVIKEIYCGGCMRTPEEGTYQYDKYITVHNNNSETVYLDGLCYGILDPYNSQASNVWLSYDEITGAAIYADELYLLQAVWQIGGTGTDFPLEPGEDAVIVNCGAIDHRAQYPLSVNLNREDYFVLYDGGVLFSNTSYHPAPGDKISSERWLNVVIKLGVANGWPLSVYSPAPVIFRPQGTTIQEYILEEGSVIQKIGSTVDKVLKVPIEWVNDGVEVFYGGSSDNTKRFNTLVDAGYVTQSEIYDGKSLMRKVDEVASAEAGYEVLIDTNNSTNDFYERWEASLRDE